MNFKQTENIYCAEFTADELIALVNMVRELEQQKARVAIERAQIARQEMERLTAHPKETN